MCLELPAVLDDRRTGAEPARIRTDRHAAAQQARCNSEDGELLLDKTNSEQILKIITLSSRELSLLQETNAAAARPKK